MGMGAFSRLLTRRRASSVKGKMVLGLGWFLTNFPGRFLKVAGAVGVTAGAFWAIKPHAFRFMCDRAFEKIDIDSNGQLDHLELQLAVYELYNRLNKRLPGWSDPPSRDLILDALKKFDKDGNMKLDKDEFHEFAKEFITAGSSFSPAFPGTQRPTRCCFLQPCRWLRPWCPACRPCQTAWPPPCCHLWAKLPRPSTQ